MNLLKAYYHFINNPTVTLKTGFAERSFNEAIWGYFVAGLSWVLFFNIGDGLSVPAFLFKLFVLFLAELTIGYLVASVCALFLDFSDIKTSPAELFILVGISGFIKGLLIGVALISAALPFAQLGFLAPIAMVLVWGLQLAYLTYAVKCAYLINVGKALTTWLFAFVPAIIVCILLFIFFIWTITLLF
ncbi:MAG: hypothetical protein J6S61_01205 [Elusimicrobiaceae bacterium]|nr:hypothetical protein [Elusimicrobiaceae bacterium]